MAVYGAGQVAFGPAAACLITVFGAKYNPAEVIGRANALLKVMDVQLPQSPSMLANNHSMTGSAFASGWPP